MLREAPTESDQRSRLEVLRRASMVAYPLAGLTALATTVLPDPDPSDHSALVIVAAFTMLNAVAMALFGRHEWGTVLFGITAAVVLTSATVAVGRPLAMSPIYYVYPTITSAYYLTKRGSRLHLLLILVTFAIAMVFADADGKVGIYLMTAPVICVLSLFTRLMGDRADALRAELREVAATDELTGLLNRRAFAAAWAREAHRAQRGGQPLSLVLFDLDHFKLVNDRFGHAAGDEALRRFAGLLADELRAGDVAARLGGEEFTVALLNCDEGAARAWARRVATRLEQVTGAEQVALSTSAGVAERPDRSLELDPVLSGADRALYAAKDAGRRCVMTVSDPGVGPLTRAA